MSSLLFEKGLQYYKDEPDLAKFHIMAATTYFKQVT